jgi:hypothetical protein
VKLTGAGLIKSWTLYDANVAITYKKKDRFSALQTDNLPSKTKSASIRLFINILQEMKKLMLVTLLALMAGGAFCQSKSKTTDTVKATNTETISPTAFKVSYDYLFKRNFDGTFSPNFPIQVNGEIMGAGAPFTKIQAFGGINVGAYEGHSILIDTIGKVVLIRKFL